MADKGKHIKYIPIYTTLYYYSCWLPHLFIKNKIKKKFVSTNCVSRFTIFFFSLPPSSAGGIAFRNF